MVEVSPAENLPKPAPLEDAARGAVAGAPVVLIAFPLGLEAILAKATERELGEIPDLPNMSPEQVGRALAKRDLVRPFITQGHVSNVTEELVVYGLIIHAGQPQ